MSDTVFLHYDQAALDAEYDNRGKVTNFQGYLNRWADSSALTRESLSCELNVPYGDSLAETLDIFLADGEGPAPIQFFIHGGYWTKLSKNELSFTANAFAPRGITTVVIDYALIPSVDMDGLVHQCRSALAWTWKNAERFGGDPERIYVSGHSAGGHLVAMLMATDWPAFDADVPANPIAGACGISGLYDLEPIRLCFVNQDVGLSRAAAANSSPVLLERRCDSPLLLAVGGLEGPEYSRQSQSLVDAWEGGEERPTLEILDDLHHFSIVTQLEDKASHLSRLMQAQIDLR